MSKIILATSLVVATFGAAIITASCSTQSDPPPEENLGRVSSALEDGGPDGGAVKRGDLVISQVYTGGGTPGATFNRDYVELFNRSQKTVSLDGLSLQYAEDTEDFGSVVELSGSIPPGGYFLIGLAQGVIGSAIPTPDAIGTIGLALANGKVALAPSTTALGCGGATRCDSSKVLDLVGYGAVTDFEGNQSVLPLDATKAALRKGNGCTDTNENRADFTLDTPAPRNSATNPAPCPVPPAPGKKDAGPTPPVVDPPLGEEPPYDAGTPKDAGKITPSGGAEASECSMGRAYGKHPGAALVLVLGVGLALSARRRRARS
jgi:hypothetical protein